MKAPQTKRDVHKLTGRLAALRRFISRSAEKVLPFFDTLKGVKEFKWTVECEVAFKKVKEYLSTVPLLTRPIGEETLQLYLAATDRTVGAVLIKEEAEVQKPCFM